MRSLFSLFLLLAVSAHAQTHLVGIVTDPGSDAPVSTATARLVDTGGKIRRFASTNARGVFRLAVPAERSGLRLQVAKMGHATAEYGLDTLSLADTLRVIFPREVVQLREVGVRAARIRENGDTVTYNVGQFARKQDRSIGEAMNRMPGLEVSGTGKVKYQGEEINRMYVDGTDVAGDAYGVITKNVASDDVKAVEVLENHQPMQVLRGLTYSDRAAVNIRMKDRARLKIVGYGEAGGGWGDGTGGLYKGDLFLMNVGGRVQNLTSFGLDNLGHSSGFRYFPGQDGAGESLDGYTSVGGASSPGKSSFNRSAAFSTNVTWKNRHGGQWRVQAGYSYDHIWSDRSDVTTYYLENGNRVVTENTHNDRHAHAASLSANYELNEKKYYLSNILYGSFSWNDAHIDVTGSLANSQCARLPDHNITNRLKIIRRFGERNLVTFNSVNQWLSRPERLWVSLGEADSTELTGRDYGSRVRQYGFFTDERASYGFIWKRLISTVEGGLAAFVRHLESNLSGDLGALAPDGTSNLSTNYFRLFVQPKFELNLRRVSFTLKMPLNYYTYWFGGALKNRNEFFVSPSLSVQWKPNRRHTVNISGSARRSPAGLHNIHSGEILSDYRTFNAGVDDYYTSSGQSVGFRWEWRNVRRGLFAYVNASQKWDRRKVGTSQYVVGDYVVNTFNYSPTSSESTSVRGDIEKTVDAINAKFILRGSWDRGSETLYSQGNPVNRKSYAYNLSPAFDIQALDWLQCNYRFSFDRSAMELGGLDPQRTDSYCHSFGFIFTPRRWIFSLNADARRDQTGPHAYKNRFDLGGYVRYVHSRRVSFTLNLSNLLNKRDYYIRSFDGITAFESNIRQRGREICLSIRITQ